MKKCLLCIGMAVMVLSFASAAHATAHDSAAHAAEAAEPVSISHELIGNASNGPTDTFNFALNITNNGSATLLNASISPAPIGPLADGLLPPAPGESSVSIGDIPASGAVSTSYTIQSSLILEEREIESFPIFWEIKYTDAIGQAQVIIVESQPASGL